MYTSYNIENDAIINAYSYIKEKMHIQVTLVENKSYCVTHIKAFIIFKMDNN